MIDPEARRQADQIRLDSEKTQPERNRLGQYATPPDLAREMVSLGLQHLDSSDVAFLEPSVGSGAFFSALHSQLEPPRRLIRGVGVELDDRFARLADELWSPLGLTVEHADFTQWATAADYRANLVVANPPYVRHHHLDAAAKKRLVTESSRIAGARVSGLSGLYVHFIFLTQRLLLPDAVSLWLIPTEFMDTNYGEELRNWLASSPELLRIHRFAASDVQFGDALVSSAVVVFRNRQPAADHRVELSYGGGLLSPSRSRLVSPKTLLSESKWAGITTLGKSTKKSSVVLGDFFEIKRGIATGANKLFILPRTEVVALGFLESSYRPILPSSRFISGDNIDTDSEGWPLISPQLALIDSPLPEELLRERDPALWDYLHHEQWAKVRGGYLVKKRKPWYRQENRPAAPIVLTYMGRPSGSSEGGLRFIRNRSSATATNGYLLLYPRPAWATQAQSTPELLDAAHQRLLEVSAATIQAGGRSYGGGLQKIEPRELAGLPIPSLTNLLGGELEQQSRLI